MNWIETLIIAAGISLDLLAAVECQGAVVTKVRTKPLVLISLLLSAWQLVSLYLGSLCAGLLCRYDLKDRSVFTGRVIAVAVFFCLGIRLLLKAWKREHLNESREDRPDYRHFAHLGAVTAIYTFLTGAAFGFLETDVVLIMLMVLGITILCVVGGMYIGYHYGSESGSRMYVLGGILLLGAGVDVIVRYVI